MLLRADTHWETSLHGVELIPGLDLRRGQHHRCAMMNAMKGDLLDAGRDVMEASVDGRRSHIHRQLEGLQLHSQGYRL